MLSRASIFWGSLDAWTTASNRASHTAWGRVTRARNSGRYGEGCRPTEPEDDRADPGRFSSAGTSWTGGAYRTDDAGYVVTHHGDADGFWYEPSVKMD